MENIACLICLFIICGNIQILMNLGILFLYFGVPFMYVGVVSYLYMVSLSHTKTIHPPQRFPNSIVYIESHRQNLISYPKTFIEYS